MTGHYSRRRFLHLLSAAGVASLHARAQMQMPMQNPKQDPGPPGFDTVGKLAVPQLNIFNLTPFVDPLPLPQRLVAQRGHRLHMTMREIRARIHRDVLPTRMWSYGPSALAPVIEARSGTPFEVEWINQLPLKHFLPIDHNLHGAGTDVPDVRACVHLHGGRVPSADDGQPEDWYVPGKSRICRYPMQQDATALWFHDHAMGINRLNIYAGLFGMLLLRDANEEKLHLPSGAHELPLILYDRELTTDGQLFYPVSPDPASPWVTQFTGDAVLINGKLKPFLEVEPRVYRLRLLNSSNSRFFNLSASNGPLIQIGSDQGLLSAPVSLQRVELSPAERADVLLDLSASAGERVHLRTDAQDILEFRVQRKTASAPAFSLPKSLRPIARTPEAESIVTRRIVLEEFYDQRGQTMMMLINRKHWHEPVTEQPKLNTTEIWEFYNVTDDTHPMHLHLVRFQVLDRRIFDRDTFQRHKTVQYLAPALLPQAQELGWKDVVPCPPGMVTRIIVHFEGFTGNYLYHCHILEHEANDMMRPFEVMA